MGGFGVAFLVVERLLALKAELRVTIWGATGLTQERPPPGRGRPKTARKKCLGGQKNIWGLPVPRNPKILGCVMHNKLILHAPKLGVRGT